MSNSPDPFDFVKQLWGQMAVPGFGLTAGAGSPGAPGATQMPSFDPKDLEKRLAELKQVKQWLEMNLNVMSLQINTLEMQLAAMTGFKHASDQMFGDKGAKSVGGSDSAAGAPGPVAGSAGASGGANATAAPWMDPQAWMKFMQAQAASMQQASQKAMQDGAAAAQSAASGARSKAEKSPAAKAPRGRNRA